jgi:cysteine desulfurase
LKAYFDHIATTPLHPEVYEEMVPFLTTHFGNPQSLHEFGEPAREALMKARERVASLIKSNPDEIYFTSSGTEANNFAIKGVAKARRGKGNHIVASSIEHFSVLYPLRSLEKEGFEVTYLPVDKYGIVHPDEVKKALRKETILVSVMHANNEVGTIEPIEEIAQVVKEHSDAYFHTDAVQSVGHIEVEVEKMGVDLLTLSAHQFYGPKGVGAIYIKKGTRILPLLEGGIQEEGKRAGIENVPGIVGLGKACEIAQKEMATWRKHLSSLQKKLKEGISERIERIYFTGHPEKRIPGHVSLCVEFIEGEAMLMLLNAKGIAAASGSTCTSRALKASHVLTAMGIPPEIIQGSLVLSLGRENTEEEIDYFLEVFPPIVERLRKMSPLYTKFIQERGGS